MSRRRPQDRHPDQPTPRVSAERDPEDAEEGSLDALFAGAEASGAPGTDTVPDGEWDDPSDGGGEADGSQGDGSEGDEPAARGAQATAGGRGTSGGRRHGGNRGASGDPAASGSVAGSGRLKRPGTPRRVMITAILGAFLGALSLVFALNLDVNLSWIWAAVVGLLLAGAAWVMAALEGSPKRWGMLAAAVCVLGIGAPIAVNVAFNREVTELSLRQEALTDQGEEYNEAAAASQLPEQVKGAVGLGSAQFVAGARVSVDAVERDASAAIKAEDPAAPAPEGRYVTATVTVQNNAEEPVDPATALGADLIFADGTVVDSTQCVATLKRPVLNVGALEQGKQATFDVCFDVPASHSAADKVDAAAVRVSNQVDPTQAAAFWKSK